jgi:transcriptional regulator with XRE-family HTH domain
MQISHTLRSLREEKGLSQGDIEKRTSLLRCYISRVENGHTVPSVMTLEKVAQALEIPLYQIFYGHEDSPGAKESLGGRSGKEERFLRKIRGAMSQMNERDRRLLLGLARKLAKQ